MTSTYQAPTLLKPTEAARALRLSYSTILRMIHDGDLRASRVGAAGQFRIPVSEIERLAGLSQS